MVVVVAVVMMLMLVTVVMVVRVMVMTLVVVVVVVVMMVIKGRRKQELTHMECLLQNVILQHSCEESIITSILQTKYSGTEMFCN